MAAASQSLLLQTLHRTYCIGPQAHKSKVPILSAQLKNPLRGQRPFVAMASSATSTQDAPSQQSSRQYESLKGSLVCATLPASFCLRHRPILARRAKASDWATQVYQVAEQRKTDITELWGDNDISVIFWARSMGCFFCQFVPVIP